MLKWIIGALLVLVAATIGTCWVGYVKLTEGGNAAAVWIATTPERAWTYLADPDSLAVRYRDSTGGVRVSAHTAEGLAVGDSMWIGRLQETTGEVQRDMAWVVTRLVPQQVVAWAAIDDSTGLAFMRRTDSLTALDDSVEVRITYEATLLDSLRTSDSVGRLGGRLLAGTSKLMVSGMRLTAERELAHLKALLERP